MRAVCSLWLKAFLGCFVDHLNDLSGDDIFLNKQGMPKYDSDLSAQVKFDHSYSLLNLLALQIQANSNLIWKVIFSWDK